jgi:hypothetical protein
MTESIDIPHEVTVGRLTELLAQLREDDILVPNSVRNLLIVRDNRSIGFIDLLIGQAALNIWDDDHDENS